jgi:hypothetical protein
MYTLADFRALAAADSARNELLAYISPEHYSTSDISPEDI